MLLTITSPPPSHAHVEVAEVGALGLAGYTELPPHTVPPDLAVNVSCSLGVGGPVSDLARVAVDMRTLSGAVGVGGGTFPRMSGHLSSGYLPRETCALPYHGPHPTESRSIHSPATSITIINSDITTITHPSTPPLPSECVSVL